MSSEPNGVEKTNLMPEPLQKAFLYASMFLVAIVYGMVLILLFKCIEINLECKFFNELVHLIAIALTGMIGLLGLVKYADTKGMEVLNKTKELKKEEEKDRIMSIEEQLAFLTESFVYEVFNNEREAGTEAFESEGIRELLKNGFKSTKLLGLLLEKDFEGFKDIFRQYCYSKSVDKKGVEQEEFTSKSIKEIEKDSNMKRLYYIGRQNYGKMLRDMDIFDYNGKEFTYNPKSK